MSDYRIETIAVHGGYEKTDPVTGSRCVPIYQTTAYEFKSVEHAVNLFDLKEFGYIYTRMNNPTVEILETRLAQLEGGTAAVATASGQFAEYMAITSLAEAGDNIVAAATLYGGTFNLFKHTFKKLGIEVRFVSQDDLDAMQAAIDDKTKCVYIESVANPGNDVPDIEAIANLAHDNGLPLMIDNTYPTPYLCRPKDFGADIIIHSLTKFLGGHGNSMGGVAIDCGTFDWKASGRFPGLTEPDESYHGIVYADQFPGMALAVKMRVQVMRDVGGCLAPLNAFLLLQGIETLHLRMERHVENTRKLVDHLAGHPKISWVSYPDLPDNRNHERVKKYLPKGSGAMLAFGIKGGFEAGKTFIEGVELATHLTNLGDVRTLVTHPASTTHRQLSSEAREKAGIPDELVRVSVGLEHIDDIIADFDQALAKA